MTSQTMIKRLASLEVANPASREMTPEEVDDAMRLFEESLSNPPPPDPRAVAYRERTDLMQLADDYQAMLRGALAPWETH